MAESPKADFCSGGKITGKRLVFLLYFVRPALNIQMNFGKPEIIGLAPHFPGYNIGETLPVATSWAERG